MMRSLPLQGAGGVSAVGIGVGGVGVGLSAGVTASSASLVTRNSSFADDDLDLPTYVLLMLTCVMLQQQSAAVVCVSASFGFLNEFLFTSGASFWWQCKHKQTTGSV